MISTATFGAFGYVFSDFGKAFNVRDLNGEAPASRIITDVSFDGMYRPGGSLPVAINVLWWKLQTDLAGPVQKYCTFFLVACPTFSLLGCCTLSLLGQYTFSLLKYHTFSLLQYSTFLRSHPLYIYTT